VRTVVLLFVVPAVVLGVVSYYDEPSLVPSCIIGIGCGAVCAGMGWKRISAERRGEAPSPESERAQASSAAVRLAVFFSVFLVFSVIAIAAHSLWILALGVVMAILASIALRVLRR
jgi:hypothetical protein